MKSLVLNLIALALFSAFAAAAGMLTAEVLIFQLAAQWLVNELWFDAYLVPALLMQLFGRKGEGRDVARQRCAARWTSFCLLLLPAILYGILSLVEALSSNALSHWLGLPLGSGLYSCSFGAFVLLFMLSLFTGAMPLSVQAALEGLFDDKMNDARAEMKAEMKAEIERNAEAPSLPPVQLAGSEFAAIPAHHSRLFAEHERDLVRKLQAGEELLLATAPAGEVPMGDEIQSYLFGGGFGAAGLFLLASGYTLQQSGELAGFALWAFYVMGAAFLLFALPVLLAPLRWRRRLRGIDYFITNRRLFIYRGEEVHSQIWSEPCICHLTPRAGSCGDISVIRKGRGYHILRTFFKRWAGFNEEETRRSFDTGTFNNGKDMQTQALINVEGAQAIHALITDLLAEAQSQAR